MKLEEKSKARQLRYQGLSMKEIATILKVSKSSISAWVHDIELTDEALIGIKNQKRLGREKSRQTRLSNIANRNIALFGRCKDEILPISKRDMWIAGLMLYAGEGRKTARVSDQHIELVNSDPNILRMFINFLIYVCFVPKEKIKIRLFLYEDIDLKEAQRYWSSELNIPLNQFQKAFIKQSYMNLPRRHLRRSKYGTAHINLNDVRIYRKVMSWLQAMYEYNNLLYGISKISHFPSPQRGEG
ncbi:MAG: hypothetical protein KKD11_02085 [Candidatus Omnitrophica bacterium]|nr:hypothetical protein [Candidatus Omnitrophota bacterium]